MASVRLLAVAVALATLVTFACGDGSSAPATVAPTFVANPTQPPIASLGDPGLTVRNAVQACREKDADLLKTFVAGDVSLTDIAALFARGSDVRLISQSIPEPAGDTASITVRLHIEREGASEEVARTWDLVRSDDGLWRLTELPDCF
ncbi:MAG: hypothetical protein WEB04_04820 [Dehalococcoidia bacterium]